MKATEFEARHPSLLRLLLITAAFLTYLFQREDVVWAIVKSSPQSRLFERSLFALATLLIGAGAGILTRVRVSSGLDGANGAAAARASYALYLGNLLYSVGLGSLAPFSGFVILVSGQTLLGFRLMRCGALAHGEVSHPASSFPQALRQEAGKWGLFLTMIVFTVLLVDRVAEILAVASFVVWAVLNLPHFHHSLSPTKALYSARPHPPSG